jgi:predicted phage terminase large subunit-like protein
VNEQARAALLADPAAVADEVARVRAERRLLPFVELLWHVVEPGRDLVMGWALECVAEHLEAVTAGEIRHLLITLPPGLMKSLLTDVFWPAWEWGPRDMPSMRYVCASYSEALTIRDNRRCRNVIQSSIYQANWGDRFQLDSDQNAKIRFDNDRTGFKVATSVGGLGTGERGDRVIVDDAHNVKEAESDLKRESVLHWFAEVVPTRVNDPEKSAFIVIMQRVHERDLAGQILKELNYEWVNLPMEYERGHRCFTSVTRPGVSPERVAKVQKDGEPVPRWVKEEEATDEDLVFRDLTPQDRREYEGELLFPERFTAGYVENELKPSLRSWGGEFAVSSQLQQRPAPRGGGMFQRSDFQFVDQVPEGGKWCRGWDLAASTTKGAAFTVGVLMGKVRGRIYVADIRRFKEGPGGVERRVKAAAEADGHGVLQSLPQDPGQAGLSQKAAFAQLLHGYNFKFSPETGSKEDRARPLAAQCEAGNVYLVRGAAWVDAFIGEATSFPAGAFKDQVDAASRAYSELIRRREQLVGLAPVVVNAGPGYATGPPSSSSWPSGAGDHGTFGGPGLS